MGTEGKTRITVKISSELAQVLLQKHQEAESQSTAPVFKEVYLGEQVEKALQCWNFGDTMADILVEDELKKKWGKQTEELVRQYEERMATAAKKIKRTNNRGLIAGIILCLIALILIFFNQRTSEYS